MARFDSLQFGLWGEAVTRPEDMDSRFNEVLRRILAHNYFLFNSASREGEKDGDTELPVHLVQGYPGHPHHLPHILILHHTRRQKSDCNSTLNQPNWQN